MSNLKFDGFILGLLKDGDATKRKKLSAAFLLFFHKTDKTILRVGNSKKGFYRCQTIIYSFCFAPRS